MVKRGRSDRGHAAGVYQARARLWICGQPPHALLPPPVRQQGVVHKSTGASAAKEGIQVFLLRVVEAAAERTTDFHSLRRGGMYFRP